MEPFVKGIIIMFLGFLCIPTDAQKSEIQPLTDSVNVQTTEPVKIHLPGKATIYSAVLPGLGQIYNRKWWKVPFIYGGFAALGYYINYNNQQYKINKQAYLDMADKDPLTNSYQKFYDDIVNELDPPSNWEKIFKTRISTYSRRRDLYIIGAVGFYLINILDANVNAHFIDFDISEDLTFHFEPLPSDPLTNTPIPGMTLVYKFK